MTDQQLLSSIFRIQSRVDSGTCFLFGDNRHVLTAKHVVVTSTGGIAGDIIIEVEPGKPQRAVNWQVLGSFDIALIEFANDLPGTPLEAAAVAGDPTPGAEFRAAGFPVNVSEKWQPGKLVGRVKRGEYEIRFEHSFTSQLSGLSGAPVLDSENRVLGVIIEHDVFTPTAGKMVPLIDFQPELDLSGPTAAFSCLAIFSDHEPSGDGVLRIAVREATEILAAEWDLKIDLTQHFATDCIDTRESYTNVVRSICHADVCIFDLTGYEPAIMLLLGIRSVVKRGITIGSASAGIENAPYDIKELSLLNHSQGVSRGLKLRNVIAQRIRIGRAAQSLQHYLDLPTFDAVRNLPPGRRSEILPKERILLLSSYGAGSEENLEYIQDRLQFELQKRKIEQPNVSRVIDLNAQSPWLVSQNMYEAIRRTKLCIADWTGFPSWPANVFFELGVRISVRDSATFCILDERVSESQAESAQQKKLIKLFNPVRYRLTDVSGERFAAMMLSWDHFTTGDAENAEGPCEYTFRGITDAFDVRQGILATTVVSYLLNSAQLLSADDTEALSGVLYPKNSDLRVAAGVAVKERLWAAWYYLHAKYNLTEIAQDLDLFDATKNIARELAAVLGANNPEYKPVKETMKNLFEVKK